MTENEQTLREMGETHKKSADHYDETFTKSKMVDSYVNYHAVRAAACLAGAEAIARVRDLEKELEKYKELLQIEKDFIDSRGNLPGEWHG